MGGAGGGRYITIEMKLRTRVLVIRRTGWERTGVGSGLIVVGVVWNGLRTTLELNYRDVRLRAFAAGNNSNAR